MKKILLAVISILFVSQSFGQIMSNSQKDIKTKHVPDDVISSFGTKFGSDVIPTWEHNGSDYYAGFEIDKINYEAKFSKGGGWLETTKQVTQADLPDAVNDALFNGSYQDWMKADIVFIQRATGENMYRASVIKEEQKRSLLITPQGKITDSIRL